MQTSLVFRTFLPMFMVVLAQGRGHENFSVPVELLPNDIPYGRIVFNIEPPKGWELVFDRPYNYAVSTYDLRSLSTKCNSKILVGARRSEDAALLVAASGPAAILQVETSWLNGCGGSASIDQVKFFGVWWYFIPYHSFGFAPDARSEPDAPVDVITSDPEYRLSWWLDTAYGGYRAGVNLHLENSTAYRMLIYCQ